MRACVPRAQGPIYVCTTADGLEDVLERTPAARTRDLVLFQNGWILPLLASRGIHDATLVALYMAGEASVPRAGIMPAAHLLLHSASCSVQGPAHFRVLEVLPFQHAWQKV
jgi:hypothetical protein